MHLKNFLPLLLILLSCSTYGQTKDLNKVLVPRDSLWTVFWNYEFTKQELRRQNQKVETLTFLVSVQDSALVKHKAINQQLTSVMIPSLEADIKAQQDALKRFQKQKRKEKARSFGFGALAGALIILIAGG